MEKNFFVYVLTHKENGKKYVGAKKNTDRNKRQIRLTGQLLQNEKSRNFRREIIEYFESSQEAYEKEAFMINNLNTVYPDGYNISPTGGTHRGGANNESSNKKRSDVLTGRVFSEEWKKRIGEKSKRSCSEETKEKIRNTMKGRPSHLKGTTLSEEHKKKMKEAQSGEKNHYYGKQHSEETRLKMKAYWEKRRNNEV